MKDNIIRFSFQDRLNIIFHVFNSSTSKNPYFYIGFICFENFFSYSRNSSLIPSMEISPSWSFQQQPRWDCERWMRDGDAQPGIFQGTSMNNSSTIYNKRSRREKLGVYSVLNSIFWTNFTTHFTFSGTIFIRVWAKKVFPTLLSI